MSDQEEMKDGKESSSLQLLELMFVQIWRKLVIGVHIFYHLYMVGQVNLPSTAADSSAATGTGSAAAGVSVTAGVSSVVSGTAAAVSAAGSVLVVVVSAVLLSGFAC